LDHSSAALKRFGVRPYQRVHTPSGDGTVIGVDQEHSFLWFQLDKDMGEGISYWDDITNYDSLICKGVIPTADSATSRQVPLPSSSVGLLGSIHNATEKEAMTKAIQESLVDERQKEIQQYFRSLQL